MQYFQVKTAIYVRRLGEKAQLHYLKAFGLSARFSLHRQRAC
jgi:hypothetical protein